MTSGLQPTSVESLADSCQDLSTVQLLFVKAPLRKSSSLEFVDKSCQELSTWYSYQFNGIKRQPYFEAKNNA